MNNATTLDPHPSSRIDTVLRINVWLLVPPDSQSYSSWITLSRRCHTPPPKPQHTGVLSWASACPSWTIWFIFPAHPCRSLIRGNIVNSALVCQLLSELIVASRITAPAESDIRSLMNIWSSGMQRLVDARSHRLVHRRLPLRAPLTASKV